MWQMKIDYNHMKHVCVIGATGYIGSKLALHLANEGYCVHALYRDENKGAKLKHQNIKLVHGSLDDKMALEKAMYLCDGVFHTAAYTQPWSKDPKIYYTTNVTGTIHVIAAAKAAKVRRCVFTSTAGVFGPSASGIINEDHSSTHPFFSHYETSKHEADRIILNDQSGIEMIIVHPTRVIGPGLMSHSNGVTRLIQMYLKGQWHIIPGDGRASGNYVFVEDVVRGHLLAYKHGRDKERYILGGENICYNAFFKELKRQSECSYFLVKVPIFVMLIIAAMMQFFARVCSTQPLVSMGFVRKFYSNWKVTSDKAIEELGYTPISFRKSLSITIQWLREQYLV